MNKIDKIAEDIVITALLFIGISSLIYFSAADAIQKPINAALVVSLGLIISIIIFILLIKNEV